jgi:hypothetical protein
MVDWHLNRWGAKAKPPVFSPFSPAALLYSTRVARNCVMARGVNWSQIARRKRMRRQGVEDIKGATPVASQPPRKPRRKVSKAELREQAAAAFLAWRAGQTSKNK